MVAPANKVEQILCQNATQLRNELAECETDFPWKSAGKFVSDHRFMRTASGRIDDLFISVVHSE
jgi:hypothetical protein